MKFYFWSYNDDELHNAWYKELGHFDFVEILRGDILSHPSTYIVSPANSFGFMDGGIDLFYRNYFGMELENNIKKIIKDKHNGELLVGQSEVVSLNKYGFNSMIFAPTMRTPTILGNGSPNPYLAMRAILLSEPFKSRTLEVKTISIPGLGTGVGKMDPIICARQVRLAIERFYLSNTVWYPIGFHDAKLPGDTRTGINKLVEDAMDLKP